MKIYVLENLIKQTHKTSFSRVILDQIYDEFQNIIDAEAKGFNSLKEYLNKNNGKELKGAEYIWKFRLNAGDRILYTWGEYLPYINEPKSLVLIAYATHDKQGDYKKLPEKQDYTEAKDLIHDKNELTDLDIKDLCDDDYEALISSIFENNYHDRHAIYVVDDETLQKADIKDLDVKLSYKQQDIIDEYNLEPIPTLILGGAGTGKTVLAVHLLNDRSISDSCKYAYFTQSRELLGKVENQYKTITKKKDISNINFFDINEYCRIKLNLKKINFIETPQFLNYVRNDSNILHLLKKNELTELDLWTEIRGVIKGLTNTNWNRVKVQSQKDFSGAVIKNLEENGFIKRKECNPQLFDLSNNYQSLSKDNLSNDAQKILQELISYYNSFDSSVEELSEEDYMKLSDELTMVEVEKRKSVYSIYLKYKQWLNSNNFYDDNDLARRTIQLFQNSEYEKFDFAVVDEVQDYTEIQIYLISQLVIRDEFLIFAGDVHQIINPTVFNERKLNKLFKNKLKVQYLEKNFRCQKKVVKLGNEVARIRREKIAAKKHEIEETSERDGEAPKILSHNAENVKKMMSYILNYPGVAVLVPEESTKLELIELIGKSTYENVKTKRIYTISEIKGMEYKYVVCYNMLSTYSSFWNIIMSDDVSTKVTRFRYYFNLFYVAITRSLQYLCLLESDSNNAFYKELLKNIEFEQISEYNKTKLSLNHLSSDNFDWLSDAEDNEKAGNYEEAKESYINAGANIENIWRCDAEMAVNKHDFESAIKYFLLLNKEDRVKQYFEEINTETSIWFLARTYLMPQGFSKSNGIERDSLTKWANDIFNNEQEEYKYLMLKNILNKLQTEYIRWANK